MLINPGYKITFPDHISILSPWLVQRGLHGLAVAWIIRTDAVKSWHKWSYFKMELGQPFQRNALHVLLFESLECLNRENTSGLSQTNVVLQT